MQNLPYTQFKKLSKDKQSEMVSELKQSAPTAISQISKFPEIDFIPLTSTQDKKEIKLATYRYAAEKTKGVIIFFHSLGLHTGMSGNMAKLFAFNGYTFVGYDQRGHGKSEGERAYFDDYKLIMKDAHTFIGSTFKSYPNVPVFLLGHGMGSLLAVVFSQQFKQFKFAGIILTSPSLKKPANSKVLSALSDFALKLMPNKAGIFPLNFENVCRNPTAADYFTKDPNIYHEKIQVGTLTQMMEIMQKNEEKKWSKIETCPVIIIQGQCDKVADPINAINFYESIKTKDKEFHWMPTMWNNYFLDPEAEQVSNRVLKWVSAR